MKRSVLLISSSNLSGRGYLDAFEEAIKNFLQDIPEIVFVPYAADKINWDVYTQKVRDRFKLFGVEVKGIHEPAIENNIEDCKAIFIGGGNSFRLLYHLQKFDLLAKINSAVLTKGLRYMGSSAGSNVACKTICTTNDMPIIYPPKGFNAINLITLQINPHYIDPDPTSTHMGETRDERIKEFHEANSTPVIGLREGAFLLVDDEYYQSGKIFLGGTNGAKFFFPGKESVNISESREFLITQDNVI